MGRQWIWGQAISASVPYGLTRCEELGQNRKENYELFILDSCTNSSACSIFIYDALGVSFKRQASSCKRQAASNTNQVTSLPQFGGTGVTTKGKNE